MRARQTPTYETNIPADLSGDGEMAARLAEAYFGEPMPWQPHLLDVMLARDDHDKFRAKTVGISIPRQNGKSWDVRARCFYGALNGECILYTCQHGDTSNDMFRALSAPFESEDDPELHALLVAVRKANGQQSIILRNGGLIRFTTRTDRLARGTTYDVLIYDEAQDLTSNQQAASLPVISAGAKHNPQTIYLGTPPGPDNAGTVFRDLHDAAHSGKSGAAWIEWATDEIGDVTDRDRWYMCNPSLGTLIDIAAVEGECDQMAPDVFARERLGWWSPVGGVQNPALDGNRWLACRSDAAMQDGKLAFGVKFSPDGGTVAISWARAVRGGGSYVELYDVQGAGGGTAGIADMLLRNQDEIAAVCIDGKTGAAALIQRLRDARFPKKAVIEGSPSVAQAAATMLRDEVDSGALSHIESPALDESAMKSVRRDIGRDGWGFGDGPNSISAPIESASLALYAARTTRRDPQRIQEASF